MQIGARHTNTNQRRRKASRNLLQLTDWRLVSTKESLTNIASKKWHVVSEDWSFSNVLENVCGSSSHRIHPWGFLCMQICFITFTPSDMSALCSFQILLCGW